MNKQRRKMTPEEMKDAEYWQALRAQKIPELKFALMMKHCGGQCEMVLESGERCPHRHGKPGARINGTIILSPKLGKQPILICQKCGFEAIKKQIHSPVAARPGRPRKKNEAQEVLT